MIDTKKLWMNDIRAMTGIHSPRTLSELADWCMRMQTGEVRYVFWTPRLVYIDRRKDTIRAMRLLGAKNIRQGNDAPRDGQLGNYLEAI